MDISEKLVTRLQTFNLRGGWAVGVGTPLSGQALTVVAHGVAPGRKVVDTVTGQTVEVISSTTVHLPSDAIPR